jgi:hypothetical protein
LLQNNKRLLESAKSSASKKARLFERDNFKSTSKLLIPLCPNSSKYKPNSLIQTDRLQPGLGYRRNYILWDAIKK